MTQDDQPSVIWAIPDTHGCLPQLLAALDLIALDDHPTRQVVFLGDYVDRGPDSLGVLATVKNVCDRYTGHAVALLGNHEVDMLEWLEGDDEDPSWLLADTDLITIRSFLNPDDLRSMFAGVDLTEFDAVVHLNQAVKAALVSQHGDLFQWLRDRPLYYETDDQIFVHAGVDEEAGDLWRLATEDLTFTHKYPPTTGSFTKTIVAGHVGTPNFHAVGSHGIYFDGASHYYLDGCVETTGDLNLLKYTVATDEYEAFVVTV